MRIEKRGLRIAAFTLSLAGAGSVLGAAPIDYDASRAAMGRALFKSYCASCHGKEAKGDGPVAKYMEVRPADLTAIAARNGGTFPDDAIRDMVDGRATGVRGHGSKEMPIWGDAFQKLDDVESEEDVAKRVGALVQFLRSIQE